VRLASSSAKLSIMVVIASLCDDARIELLKRACESVRAAAGDYDYSIFVVANGTRVSSSVLDWLATKPDTRVIRMRSGSHPWPGASVRKWPTASFSRSLMTTMN